MQYFVTYLLFFIISFQITKVTLISQMEKGIYHNITFGVSVRIENDRLEEIVNSLQIILNKTSKLLCEATFGYASFGSIRLLVPSDWVSNKFDITTAKDEKFNSAEFQINDGPELFVQQSNQCGERGMYIQLPYDKLINHTSFLEKHLLVLWSQLRYGVFPEHSRGFHYNPQFISDHPNSCTNLPLNWKYKNPSCSSTSVEVCEADIDPLQNTHISSSLLFNVTYEKIKYFCNASTHNPFAHTPHNRICNGKNSFDIIMENEDFINEKHIQTCEKLSSVKIEVIQQKCQRLFIGIAIESVINVQRALENIESSLVLLLSTANAKNSTMTVINNDTVIFDADLESYNAMQLSKKLNNESLISTSCVSCILATVQREIEISSSKQCEYSFVLITDVKSVPAPRPPTSEPPTSSTTDDGSGYGELSTLISTVNTESSSVSSKTVYKRDVEEFEYDSDLSSEFIIVRQKRATSLQTDDLLVNFLREWGVKVYGIVVGNATDDSIYELAVYTGGNVFSYESIADDDVIKLLQPLIKSSESENEKKLVVNQETNNNISINNVYEMTFNLNDILISDLTISIRHSNASSLTDLFLKNLNNTFEQFGKNLHCTDFEFQKSTSCQFENITMGTWILELHLPHHTPVSVYVLTTSNPKENIFEIVKLYTIPATTVDFSNGETLKFYVIVKYGPYFIENAYVTAILTTDNAEDITIELKEDGLNPGVYSGSINSCVMKGRYVIKYTAKTISGTCMRKEETCDLLPSRYQAIEDGSVNIIDCGDVDRLIGPGVIDFKLNVSRNSFIGVLSWHEGWEKDSIVSYNLHFWKDYITKASYDDWILNSNLLRSIQPALSLGSERTETVNLRIFSNYVTLAIIAISKNGDGLVSNFVHYYTQKSTGTTTTTTAKPAAQTTTTASVITTSTTTNTLSVQKTTKRSEIKNSSKSDLSDYPYIIVGIVLLGFFTVVGLVLLVILYKIQVKRNRILPEDFESDI